MTARWLLVSTNRKNGFLRQAFESDDVFVTIHCQRLESLTSFRPCVCLLRLAGQKTPRSLLFFRHGCLAAIVVGGEGSPKSLTSFDEPVMDLKNPRPAGAGTGNMGGPIMALRHQDEHYTKWMHIEKDNMMVRRLHRIEIQARDGRLYVIRGEDLPDGFVTTAGHGYKGKHVAQILLRPLSTRRLAAPDVDDWPRARDVLHLVLGVFGFLMVRFFASFLSSL